MEEAGTVKITLKRKGGDIILKEGIKLLKGEVIDASTMNAHDFETFIEKELRSSSEKD